VWDRMSGAKPKAALWHSWLIGVDAEDRLRFGRDEPFRPAFAHYVASEVTKMARSRTARSTVRLTAVLVMMASTISTVDNIASAQTRSRSAADGFPSADQRGAAALDMSERGYRELPSMRDALGAIDYAALARQTVASTSRQSAASGSKRSVMRRVLGGMLGATAGFLAGGRIGAAIDGPCNCDDPGLKGALIGAPIGAVAGGVLGAMVF
jgi:hypothetical protein